MSQDQPGQGATIIPELFEHGRSVNAFMLVDMSRGAATNERAEKIGNRGASLGGAIATYESGQGTYGIADGLHGGEEVSSLMPFEPDNWNPRLHSGGGKGRDNVWALRLIADHSNETATKDNRSTHWIDQEFAQEWAASDDLFRIVEKQTPVDDPEVHYTLAGYLGLLTGGTDPKGLAGGGLPVQEGKATRGALALDASRNLGYVADKKNFGQLSHALVFLKTEPAPADVPTEDNTNRPDVPTEDRPRDVPSVDPRYQDSVSRLPDHSQEANPAANQNETVSRLPDHNPNQEANPAAAIASGSTVGGIFEIRGGQLFVNGQAAGSTEVEEDPGDGDSSPQVGNRAKQENELGLRLDVGFLVDKNGLVARLSDDQPPAGATDGDGDIKLVHLFVSKEEASPDDGLDTLEDDNSNHEKLPKPVKKYKIQGWVKAPKPGSSDCNHYDWSWHDPPPSSSSSGPASSMGSSGPPDVATPGGGGGSGEGTGTPPGGTSDPSGRPGVPTIDDKYQHPDGSRVLPEESSNTYVNPSKQAQHGWAPPRSPGFMIRGNIMPSDFGEGWNAVGSMVKTKAAKHKDVTVEMICAFSDDLLPGEVIELNVIVMPHEDDRGPTTYYRQAFLFTGDAGYVADPVEYKLQLYFRGFSEEAQIFTVLFERRNDTTKGVNSPAELCVIRSSLISEGAV